MYVTMNKLLIIGKFTICS